MKVTVHKAETRGHANHGWLDTNHTFSFASYYNAERMNFGMLRVLNDDFVDGGQGFGTHPHDNMEIISIPLNGSLEHKDSMGTTSVIKTNDVQIMSAGTGVSHSEWNHSKDQKVNFLQVWIFPKERNITPNYDQKGFNPADRLNKIQTLVSPEVSSDTVLINQDAYFSMTRLDADRQLDYNVNIENNGIYAFVISGSVKIGGEVLTTRDGAGFWETKKLEIEALQESEVLLIEVPMSSR